MQYLKVRSDDPFTTNSAKVSADEGYIYIKRDSNNDAQVHFMSKTGSTAIDNVLANNPKVVSVSNSSTTAACNCKNGFIFNCTNDVAANSNFNLDITNFPNIPGQGVLVRFTIGNGVTVKYGSKTIFSTLTNSDYTAGTYYVSFLYVTSLDVVNFFKEPAVS